MRFGWRRNRLSRLVTEWDAQTEAEYRAWLAFLAAPDDDTGDLPGLGSVGVATIDPRCRDHPGHAPELLHVPGCFCLLAVKIKRVDDDGGNGGERWR